MASKENPIAVWQDEYRVRSHEVDVQGNATMPLLCHLMQESASHHAAHFGLGVSHLLERDLAWVLSRQLVVMNPYPRLGEMIKIVTWPTGTERLFWYRDFKILDARDNAIGKATTTWLVIDLTKRRPQRPDACPPADLPDDLERMFPSRPGKIDALNQGTPSLSVRVGYRDLDLNEHVNNVRYIEWILDVFDLEFHKSHSLAEIEVNYLAEALYGDALSARYERVNEQTFLHSLVRDADGLELFRARTRWEHAR